MYLAIIILPLLASIVSGFFGRKIGVSGSQIITCTAVIMTTGFALLAFFEVGLNNIPVAIELFRWIDSESLYVSWLFYYDSLTVSMLIPVLIVSSLVHIYSIGYMSQDPHIQRFFSYLSLFTFMMLILVTGDNYLLMFVGWEGVGVCSYLLVAFWSTRIPANQSSLSAFLTNRVGDCFLTVGMFAILFAFGNLDYATVFSLAPYMHENVLTIVGICLVIGATAKSSQVGLHVWLPMAMEGPTPVSALIHAATMVTAGVYLLMRSSPLIEYSSVVLMICLWLGAITTVFSSLIGLYQQDIKKVIAYSTMSQLGMMVIAVGLSSYGIALFHLVNHAFYKALLFLGAGAVIHAVADNQDFRRYGGLRPFLPLTYSVMLIASLSLVAFPFMTGFYSKDFILESAFGKYYFSATVVYIIATIGAMFTTLYSVKVLYLTFLTNPNGPLINYKNAHEGDIFMSSPLMVLAVFSIFFGFVTKDMFIGLGSGFFSDNALFIHPIHEIMLDTEFAVSTVFKLLPLMFTISLSVIAIILSEFLSTTLISFKLSRTGYNIFSFFNQRFLIELFYNRFLSGIVLKLGGQTTKVLDKGSVEYIGPYGLEKGLLNISSNISNLNTGSVTTYALFITTGVVCYILFFSYVNLNIVILNILLALSLVLFSSKTPVDAILKSSMVGDTFMTLTQISGRSLREVVAGVCANEGHIVAIGQCSHAPLSTITPTAMELSQGQVPDCDTGITGVDTRHSALNGSDSFYSCHKCFGVWCRNCKFLDMLPLMVASPTCKLAYGDRLTIWPLTKGIFLHPILALNLVCMYIVTYYFYYLEISFGKAITCVSYLERQAITCVSYLDRQAIKCVSYIDTHKKSIYMLILFVIVATVTIAVYSANILHGLYALSTLLNSSEIISDVLSNTKYFFSPSMTMLKTIDGISEEERMVGDYQNCAGPTDHATGEQQNPGYEGDHVFGTETPENFTARNDDGTTNTTEGMCEGCEQPIDYATQTYQACSDCAREWCQTCVTFIESIT